MKKTMDSIPLCRAFVDKAEIDAAEKVIRSGWMTHGSVGAEFESLFAKV